MITASCKFNDHDLTDIPVLNPDGWYGKTWLIELGGTHTPLFLVVEAFSLTDAIDVLSFDETFGHQIHVEACDLAEYPEKDRCYDSSGQVIDTQRVRVDGRASCDPPFVVRYHGNGMPAEGIDPRQFAAWDSN